jgi:hypothetical protein
VRALGSYGGRKDRSGFCFGLEGKERKKRKKKAKQRTTGAQRRRARLLLPAAFGLAKHVFFDEYGLYAKLIPRLTPPENYFYI